MNIIWNFPTAEEGKKQLSDRLTTFTANAIHTYINNLDCSYDNKIHILNNLKNSLSSK